MSSQGGARPSATREGGRTWHSGMAWRLTPLTLLVLVAVFWSGCGAAGGPESTARATATARAHATETATAQALQPVIITLVAHVQGTLAAQNVKLSARVDVTNHTTAPIGLTNIFCTYPVILLQLEDSAGKKLWDTSLNGFSYPYIPPKDVATAAPGATYTWTQTVNLSAVSPSVLHLEAGVSYILVADLLQWHQGSVSQIGQAGVPQGQNVTAQTTITFH